MKSCWSLRASTAFLWVATNGQRAWTESHLAATGLLGYFNGRIFSAHEVGAWKPDPKLFLAAAEALGVAPANCAVVEHSLPGMAP